MGNYMETCLQRKQTEEKQHQQEEEFKKDEKPGGFGKEKGDFQASRTRVKLVMTKEELGWLLLQLQSKQGKKIEDLLGEIEKGRSGRNAINTQAGWKPSLESIMESPEVLEMDRV